MTDTHNPIEKNNIENIDLAFEVMKRKFDFQSDAINTLDSKVGVLLGFIGALTGGLFLILINNDPLVTLNLLSVGMFCVFLSFIALVVSTWPREYSDPPSMHTVYSEESLAKPNLNLKNQFVADIQDCYTKHAKIQRTKAMFYKVALGFLTLAFVLMFLGILETNITING